jgi:hypothetical protein
MLLDKNVVRQNIISQNVSFLLFRQNIVWWNVVGRNDIRLTDVVPIFKYVNIFEIKIGENYHDTPRQRGHGIWPDDYVPKTGVDVMITFLWDFDNFGRKSGIFIKKHF